MLDELRAEQLLNDAKTLQPQIENARIASLVERASKAAGAWENRATAISPIVDALAAELKTVESGRVALEAVIRDLPEWRGVDGKYFVQNLVDKYNARFFAELNLMELFRAASRAARYREG